MKTIIVLIPVDHIDSRKTCEFIQNTEFLSEYELRKHINGYLGVKENEDDNVLLYNLNDFMCEVNNQQLDILTEYFISYVTIKN